MFKTEKEALVKLFVLNNYKAYEVDKKVIFYNDEIEIVETVEYQFDLKHDLNTLFNKLTNEEQVHLINYIEFGSKYKASKELGLAYTTYRRKLSRILKKWRIILKDGGYLSECSKK